MSLACDTSVGVMDISGHMKVLFTPDDATLVGEHVLIKKMNAALLLQKDTSPEFAKVQRPARAETGTLSNVMEQIAPGMALISPGGLPIFAGGDFVGVIGVAHEKFERVMARFKAQTTGGRDTDLKPDQLREIIEAEKQAQEEFGVARLLDALTASPGSSLAETVLSVMDEVEKWTKPNYLEDDASILAIERLPDSK